MAWMMRGPELGRLPEPRILVVRNDGLGDFILTLPLIASLKEQLPRSRITVLVNQAILPLISLLPEIDDAIGDEGWLLKRHRGRFPPQERREGADRLLARVRGEAFDAVLLPYAEKDSARLVQKAGIPLRAGPLRRPFFWRFNAHYRRSRKGSAGAEFALNLGYLPCLGLREEYRAPALGIPEGETGKRSAAGGTRLVVLHPHKRSGTALSWPLERFAELARDFGERGFSVAVVGDEEDRPVLARHFAGLPSVHLEVGRPLPGLAALIAGSDLFVGNSSGPLHLAGLAGVPHVGFYPQNRVSAPERWRTLPVPGAPADFRRYLLASRFPRGCTLCDGERCPYFNCVASIATEQVWEAVGAWGISLHGTRGSAALHASP